MCSSAHDFGYLTVDEVAQKLTRTMETIEKLERHEGHLLNWYDIQTLAPLNPRYVSTVDSGNLLGALWTLDQGLESLMQAPLLDAQSLCGAARRRRSPAAGRPGRKIFRFGCSSPG